MVGCDPISLYFVMFTVFFSSLYVLFFSYTDYVGHAASLMATGLLDVISFVIVKQLAVVSM